MRVRQHPPAPPPQTQPAVRPHPRRRRAASASSPSQAFNRQLGLDAVGLAQVLDWAESAQAARALRGAAGPQAEAILDQLTDHVAAQVREGARFAFAAARAGRGDELMALALAATVVCAEPGEEPTAEQIRASVHLDTALGGPDLPMEVYRQAGEAAVGQAMPGQVELARASRWIVRADQLVEQWKLTGEAWRSPVLATGFTQRLARAAAAIDAWRTAVDDATRARAEVEAMAAVASAASHRQGLIEPHRVERLEMAARLVRRRSAELTMPGTLTEAVDGYTREGAWLDRARLSVSRGDAEPTLAALCARLTAEADAARQAQGPGLAQVVAGAAHDLPPGLTRIEVVPATGAAPVAASTPVLVGVLDGLGWPTFTEVLARLEEQGWTSGGRSRRCGHEAGGGGPADGYRAEPDQLAGGRAPPWRQRQREAGVRRPSGAGGGERGQDPPPALFHKADFRQGGGDATTESVIVHVGDERNRVVGVVLNNIDERLKDVTNPPQGGGSTS